MQVKKWGIFSSELAKYRKFRVRGADKWQSLFGRYFKDRYHFYLIIRLGISEWGAALYQKCEPFIIRILIYSNFAKLIERLILFIGDFMIPKAVNCSGF